MNNKQVLADEGQKLGQVDARDVATTLSRKLAQTKAFLVAIHGTGAENFNDMSIETRDTYLWGVCDLVRDCESMADALSAALHRNAKALDLGAQA